MVQNKITILDQYRKIQEGENSFKTSTCLPELANVRCVNKYTSFGDLCCTQTHIPTRSSVNITVLSMFNISFKQLCSFLQSVKTL